MLVEGGEAVESDARFYRRRACEEMSAASRAVTPEARERRLQLVDLYLQRLQAMHEPSPFVDRDLARVLGRPSSAKEIHSAFTWPGVVVSPGA